MSHYGTIPDVDDEQRALLSFYYFPEEGVFGSLGSSSGSGSFASSGTTAGMEAMPMSESPEAMSPESLQRVSPRPLDEEDEGGWTRWRWRQSTVGLSVSPTGATIVW